VSFDAALQTTQKWSMTAEALGALGAYVTLLGNEQGDLGVRDRLRVLAEAAGLPDLDTLEPPQRMMLAALARSALKQALDLLEEPLRAPGWAYSDPGVLDGWGRGSGAVPGMIAQVAPEIGQVTSLLDVGTGVGLLAVAATQVWPDVSVVGIDIWEPSLDRASKHVAEAGLADRIDATGGELVTLVGRHCESGDVLIDGVALRDPRVDDVVAVPVTGAYCFTMSNNYNGNRRIPVVFVRGGRARLVVRRETWDELLLRDVD